MGIVGAFVLLAWDVGFTGSYLLALVVCPFWFFASLVHAATRRPGWRLTLVKSGIPALTLGLVLASDAIQIRDREGKCLADYRRVPGLSGRQR